MIERLENNEQILLMYLADELPSADRADFEQMLTADASLRRELASLQASHALIQDGLARLDAASPLPVSADFAARQVGRAMRQQLARPRPAAASAGTQRAARSWWWLYPSVAAASVAILAMLWLNHQTGPSMLPPTGPNPTPQIVAEGNTGAGTLSPAAAPQNSNDADGALLLDSLKKPLAVDDQPATHGTGDDDAKRLALNDSMPQDEVSQYLLSATLGQQ